MDFCEIWLRHSLTVIFDSNNFITSSDCYLSNTSVYDLIPPTLIPIRLSCALCSVLNSKYHHVNTLTNMVDIVSMTMLECCLAMYRLTEMREAEDS